MAGAARRKRKEYRSLKISILFLSADPSDASRLRLGEEIHEIREKLQLGKSRDEYVLEQRSSIRPPDISQALLDIDPQIVHFSGHGTATGALCVEDKTGKSHPIQPEALAALFEQFSKCVNCVILNACYSESQAKAIVQCIDFVIGMNQAIGDQAAIAFSVGFYQALGAGRSIEEAYRLGCTQIQLQGIPEHLTPRLLKKERDAQTAPHFGEPTILVIGSGVGEKVLRFDAEPRLGRKQTIAEHKELPGGSGVSYTFRLGHAGYNILPVLSIGHDWAGRSIQKEIAQLAKNKQIAEFVKSDDFCCDELSTPESIVIVAGNSRTILTGKLTGFGQFGEFVQKRIEQLDNLDQLDIKAVMIGHIYADGTDLSSGRQGQITMRIVDRYAEQNAIIFTNFGRSQFNLGNKFWQRTLKKLTVFQLALDEVREFFSQDKSIKSLRDMISWFQDNEVTAIITMDKVGAIATLKGGKHGVIFARPYDLGERLVDSTGSGDAFGAGLVSYFVDKIIEFEKGKGRICKRDLDRIVTIGNFEDAIERARHWAAYCCTTLGAANGCPDQEMLEKFRDELGEQASTLVKRGDVNDFDDIMWFIDKTY